MRICAAAMLLMVGGCSHFPAAPSGTAAGPSGWRALRVGRLKGGLDAEMPEPVSAGMQDSWGHDERDEVSYELHRNITFALPARSQRLGPLQMSWGLADTEINAGEDAWREEVRAAVCSAPSPGADISDADQRKEHMSRLEHQADADEEGRCQSPDRLFQRFMEGANFLNVPQGKLVAMCPCQQNVRTDP